MSNLPCITHAAPCPYLDRAGNAKHHGQAHWICHGKPREPKRVVLVMECPALDVAREAWRRAQINSPCGNRGVAK